MNGRDPGLSLHSTTLDAALLLLAPALDAVFTPREPLPAEAIDAIESVALPAGYRSRRVILGDSWWREPAGPMGARVAERRRMPRGPASAPAPSTASGTGWVALLPARRGYRMLALGEDGACG